MMDRNDIATLANEVFEEFLTHPPQDPQNFAIRMTSGTTSGNPFLTIWQKKNGVEWGTGAMHRLIIAFGPNAMRTGNVLHSRNNAEVQDTLVLAIDVSSLGSESKRLLDDFAPDSIYGFPSFVAHIAEGMTDSARAHVHTLAFSGEAISGTLRELFTSRFPNARQVATFATAETGVITKFPCEYLSVNWYHPREGITIDIHEPDTMGVGYLLISKDLLFGRRMEEYRIGDMARIVPGTCRCGEKRTFEVYGRAGYDFIKIAGAMLRREEFDRVAAECAAFFDDYRAKAEEVVTDGALKGKITLTVYRDHDEVSPDEIAREFSSRVFLTPTQTLQQLVARGLFLPLQVVVGEEVPALAGKLMKLSKKQ